MPEAQKYFEGIITDARDLTRVRSALGPNYARDFAQRIQRQVAPQESSLNTQERLMICNMFLQLCRLEEDGDKVSMDEPALKYAHAWFNSAAAYAAANAAVTAPIVNELRRLDEVAAEESHKKQEQS